jgi:hypothetical protein
MKEPVLSILPDINEIYYGLTYFDLVSHQLGYFELWCIYKNITIILAIEFHTPMPRERGKPRSGSAWYTFAACQKKQQRFERALSMAQTQLVHRARRLRTPPMAYVEEVFLEEPSQAPLEHLLFNVPDN